MYADFINSTDDNYYGRNFVMLVEQNHGDVDVTPLGNERAQPTRVYAIPLSHAYVTSVWASMYDAINRANSVLDHVPGIDMDTTLRKRIVGEAKFLRATHYFNLVRMFGGVPIKVHETAASTASPSREHAAGSVRADRAGLERRDRRLPPAASYTGQDIGRASRGAAKTLLAKVYLQRAGTGVGTPPMGERARHGSAPASAMASALAQSAGRADARAGALEIDLGEECLGRAARGAADVLPRL